MEVSLKHVVTFCEEGKGGGLALFWDESIHVELFKMSSRHINVTVQYVPNGIKW
jgi:hypothetical protein